MDLMAVWKYLNYVHGCEYVGDSVQREEADSTKNLGKRYYQDSDSFHWLVVLREYHVNIGHLILLTNQDQEKNLIE